MSFVRMPGVETEAEATARLVASPAGSINAFLATLPVRVSAWPRGLLLHLPRIGLVVVPIEHRTGSVGGSWTCVVIRGRGAYPAGGWDIVVSADEIRRARRITEQELDSLTTDAKEPVSLVNTDSQEALDA